MAQIRGDITYNRNIKELQNNEKKVRHISIATPITQEVQEDESDDEQDNDEEESDNEKEDDNEEEGDNEEEDDNNSARNPNNRDNENKPITKEDEECWDSIITEWINNVEYENRFDNADDEALLSSEWDANFDFNGRTIHPADDDSAKWSLQSLFIATLESPTFLNSDDVFTNTQ
jgi:hypothetical protein